MNIDPICYMKAFLGNELLTWLLYRSARGITVVGWNVEFGSPLKMAAQYGDARELTIKGDSPATSPEAHRSMAEGKALCHAPILLKKGDFEYRARLDGRTFTFSLAGMNPGMVPLSDRIGYRFKELLGFYQALGEIAREFFDLRFNDSEWVSESEKMRQWITEESGR